MPLEQRRNLRYGFMYTVDYILNSAKTDEIYNGVTIDISNSGLCLYTKNCLSEGQEITIKSVLPVYSENAVVRWAESVDESSYKVGMEFKR